MKKVKLANLTVPDYVLNKPVGIHNDGTLISAKELVAKTAAPAFGLALMSKENKAKLALARLKAEPDFEIGILDNGGKYTKADVLTHIQNQTPLGLQFADIEVKYAEFFANQLLGKGALDVPNVNAKILAQPVLPADWKLIPKILWPHFKSKVVFCENTTNNVTTPAANYRIANVHPVFAAKGFEVVSLEGNHDIRTDFIPQAKDGRTVYIGGVGHGSYSTYTGDAFNHILEVGVFDPAEVNNKVLHLLSCETARDLGPNTVTKGAKAYTGYTENFVFDWTNPNLYWKCDSQFDISMANGKTVGQAIADTIAQYNAAILSVPGTVTAANLLNDRSILRSPVSGAVWGDKSARIYPYIFWFMSFADFVKK